MRTSLVICFVFSSFLIGISVWSCKKLCYSPNQIYNFRIPLQVIPGRDSIKVGDSLTVALSSSNNMINYLDPSHPVINYGGVSLQGSLGINGLVLGKDTIIDAGNQFELQPLQGTIIQKDKFGLSFNFSESSGNYVFTLLIKPKMKGLFEIILFGGSAAQSPCKKAGLTFYNVNTNTHLEFLKNSYYKGGQVSSQDSMKAYCFKVY